MVEELRGHFEASGADGRDRAPSRRAPWLRLPRAVVLRQARGGTPLGTAHRAVSPPPGVRRRGLTGIRDWNVRAGTNRAARASGSILRGGSLAQSVRSGPDRLRPAGSCRHLHRRAAARRRRAARFRFVLHVASRASVLRRRHQRRRPRTIPPKIRRRRRFGARSISIRQNHGGDWDEDLRNRRPVDARRGPRHGRVYEDRPCPRQTTGVSRDRFRFT